MIKFLLIPLIVLIISQSLKLIYKILKEGVPSRSTIWWIYQWAGGTPSTHSAVLASSLLMMWIYRNFESIFAFNIFVSLILIYNLLADRKREEIFENHIKSSADLSLISIIKKGLMMDISGHSSFEVLVGIIFGLAATFLLIIF